jgi:hypothetical protein
MFDTVRAARMCDYDKSQEGSWRVECEPNLDCFQSVDPGLLGLFSDDDKGPTILHNVRTFAPESTRNVPHLLRRLQSLDP